MTDKLSATMQIAKRVYWLAQERDDPALTIGACQALASTFFFLGDFESTRQHAMHGVEVWHSGGVQSPAEQVDSPVVVCLKDLNTVISAPNSTGCVACFSRLLVLRIHRLKPSPAKESL
jgi:hypothetical protein